jgi:hypothetical protein
VAAAGVVASVLLIGVGLSSDDVEPRGIATAASISVARADGHAVIEVQDDGNRADGHDHLQGEHRPSVESYRVTEDAASVERLLEIRGAVAEFQEEVPELCACGKLVAGRCCQAGSGIFFAVAFDLFEAGGATGGDPAPVEQRGDEDRPGYGE